MNFQPKFDSGRSLDGNFLRRVSLDLVGVIPTSDETVAFLADNAPDKRQQLIDRPSLIDRHQLASQLVVGGGQRDRKIGPAVEGSELMDLWHHAGG